MTVLEGIERTALPTRRTRVASYNFVPRNYLHDPARLNLTAYWGKTRCYALYDPVADECRLVEDGTAANTHYAYQVAGGAVVSSVRFRVKPCGRRWFAIQIGAGVAYFDLQNGVKGTVTGGFTSTMTAVPGGEYDCDLTGLHAAAACYAFLGEADNDNTYSGTGHQGTALAGGTTGSAVLAGTASAVDDVYSHQPNTPQNKNLVWPKAASDFSNGWLSGWAADGGATVVYDATNGVGNGPCARADTVNAGDGITLPLAATPSLGVAVSPNTVYSFSLSIKGAAGGESIRLGVEWYTAGGSHISGSYASATTATNAHARYTCENKTSPATAAVARIRVFQSTAAAGTFYTDELQVEQASAATSYIAPSHLPAAADTLNISDVPGTWHAPTSYNGSTKRLDFTPARTTVPDGLTYTVGPGIAIKHASLVPGDVAKPFSDEGNHQVIYDEAGGSLTITAGASAAADAADPTLDMGRKVAGSHYMKTVSLPALKGFDLAFYTPGAISAASAAAYLVGLPWTAVTTAGLAVGAATASQTDEILTIMEASGAQSAAWCHATDTIPIGWHIVQVDWDGSAWRLWLDRVEKSLTVVGTPVGFSLDGVVYLGSTTAPGSFLTGTYGHFAPHSASRSAVEVDRDYRAMKIDMSRVGVEF